MNIFKIAISAALGVSIVVGAASAQNFKATPRGNVSQARPAAPANYQPKTMRGQATSAIVRTWAGYVRSVYGTSPSVWATAMQGTFATADVHNMQLAAKMTTFEGMMSALMGQRASDEQIIDKLARSDGSLAVIQALGSPSEDLVYTAVTPCRVIDTRLVVGSIGAGETRNFVSAATNFTAQGGAASNCGIPENASAVVMNFVAVNPASGGYLTVFPFNSPRPLASSVNFVVDQVTGNELIVKQTMGQAFDFSVYAFSQAHVVADVAGYYMAPVATKLQCFNTTSNGASLGAFQTVTVGGKYCSSVGGASYTAVGGTCLMGIGDGAIIVSQTDEDVHICKFRGGSSGEVVGAVTRCCRIPGR